MAVVLPNNMPEHSEVGSNSCNGHGWMEYPFDSNTVDKVNWLRHSLAPDSPLLIQQNALSGLEREFRPRNLRHIAEVYGLESFSRDVYGSFKRVYHYLHGFRRSLKLSSVIPLDEFPAVYLRDTLERNSLEKATLVICSCTPSEIQQLKEGYHSVFGVQLEADIKKFTDGHHRELLLAHLARRTHAASYGDMDVEMFDLDYVRQISITLHESVEQITHRSPQKNILNNIVGLEEEYMSAIACSYPTYYGRSLETDLMHERHGHFERGILTTIKCSVNRPKYFAEVLHKAMRDPNGGAMRDISQIDRDIIVCLITTMAPTDIRVMKEEYQQEYRTTVDDDISHAFSDCQDCLKVLSLLLNPDALN